MLQGLTDLILLFAAAAGVPFLLDREWATAVVLAPHRPPAHAWTTRPDVYESFAAGGFRALIDRSSMRYDVAIYLG